MDTFKPIISFSSVTKQRGQVELRNENNKTGGLPCDEIKKYLLLAMVKPGTTNNSVEYDLLFESPCEIDMPMHIRVFHFRSIKEVSLHSNSINIHILHSNQFAVHSLASITPIKCGFFEKIKLFSCVIRDSRTLIKRDAAVIRKYKYESLS